MLVPKVQFNKEFVAALRKSLKKKEVARALRFLSFARCAKAPTSPKTLLDLNAFRKARNVPSTHLSVPLSSVEKTYWMGHATGGNIRSNELLSKLEKMGILFFDKKTINHGRDDITKHKSQAAFINIPLVEGFDSLSGRLNAEMNALTPKFSRKNRKEMLALRYALEIKPSFKSRKAERAALGEELCYDNIDITAEEAEENAAWLEETFKPAEVPRKILTAKDKRKINTSILCKSNAEIETLLKTYKEQASILSGNAKANLEDEIRQIETVSSHYRKTAA